MEEQVIPEELEKLIKDSGGDVMSILTRYNDDNVMGQVSDFFFGSDDLEVKTDIQNPLAVAKLRTFAEMSKKVGFIGLGNNIIDFMFYWHLYKVSDKRKSRAEYVDVMKGIGSSGIQSQEDEKKEFRERIDG